MELRRTRLRAHDIGYRLLWTESLSDAANLGFANQLRTEGKLDSATAMVLYDRLVNLEASDVESWATNLLINTDLMDEFEQIAALRFVPDLSPEMTGHSALQDATWTAP